MNNNNNSINFNEIQPSQFDLFVGMDVDKKSIVTTTLDKDKIIKNQKFPYDANNIIKYYSRNYGDKKIAFVYEAGPTGYGLYDELTNKGYVCLIVSPSKVPVIPGARVKTNRLDSIKLAESLRGGQIKGIRVPRGIYRTLRHLVQMRDTFVKQCTATKCRIKALLLMEGLPFPTESSNNRWSRAVLCELSINKIYQGIRFKLDRLLELLEFAHKQQINTQREIRRICKTDEDTIESINYMKSIPGIGWIIASEMLVRIGDWKLLKNVRELGAFLGLTPSENSTGEKECKGNITKNGSSRLRNKLIEGSWSAIRQDGELAEFYRNVYKRHPRDRAARKAIVAVARKLTCRIYRVLKDRRFYEVRVPVEKKEKTIQTLQRVLSKKISNNMKGHFVLGDDSTRCRTTSMNTVLVGS